MHISELSLSRVFRVREIVSEGQSVEIKVLGNDTDEQRVSLSIKACQMRAEPKKAESVTKEEESMALCAARPAGPAPTGRRSWAFQQRREVRA